MDVRTCIESRVSMRSFSNTPLSDEVLYDILEAARLAPSPKNRQPWRFAVLRGSEKATAVEICRSGLKNDPKNSGRLMEGEWNSETYTFDIIDQAPVLILVFNAFPSVQSLGYYDRRFDYANIQAIGAAIENMLLQATDLGIGSLWVGDILIANQKLAQRYFEKGELVTGIVLGFAETSGFHVQRYPFSELIVFDGGKK